MIFCIFFFIKLLINTESAQLWPYKLSTAICLAVLIYGTCMWFTVCFFFVGEKCKPTAGHNDAMMQWCIVALLRHEWNGGFGLWKSTKLCFPAWMCLADLIWMILTNLTFLTFHGRIILNRKPVLRTLLTRGMHFRYFLIFSIIKNDFFEFFIKLTWLGVGCLKRIDAEIGY